MLRIVSVNQDRGIRPDRAKGAAVHLNAMRKAFADLGTVIIPIDQPDPTQVIADLARIHRRSGIDLIYERYALGKDAAAGFAAGHGIAYTVEANAPLADEQRLWRATDATSAECAADATVFGAANCVIAVSPQVADYALARGAAEKTVHVRPNGIDAEVFNIGRRDASVRSRGDLSCRPDDFVIGFHGRVRPWHRFDRLVELHLRLLALGHAVHLLVVGSGDYPELAAAPVDSVTQIGWQPYERMAEYVAAFDALPLTYGKDAPFYFSPLKLTEAMACGVVPVGPRIGDLPNSVRDRETGLIYPSDDLDCLLSSVAWLINHPHERQSLAMRAARQAAGQTWSAIAAFVLHENSLDNALTHPCASPVSGVTAENV